MKLNRKFSFTGLLLLFGLITYLFLFGKLFTFSPLIVGFEKSEFSNSIIYVQNNTKFNDYAAVDSLIPAVEKFHDLKFKQKPEIFIFRDSLNFIKRSFSKARFSAYSSGRLVISPWALKEAREGKISLEIYVRHELSHILIFQHKGFLSEFFYPKWLLEGIAVYSTNQMGTSFYPAKEETYRMIEQGNFMPPFDFKTKRENKIKLDVEYRITFMYSEFACIVDYLIEKYGKEKFLVYMKELLKSNDHNSVFKETYGLDFDDFIVNFKKHVYDTVNKNNKA